MSINIMENSSESLAKVSYLNPELRSKVGKEADTKFGAQNSYVKNLWILKEYKKRGGKTRFSGEKPSPKSIKKQVKSSKCIEVDFSDDIHEFIDEYDEDVALAEYKEYCSNFGLVAEAADNQDKINEIYKKYHATVNMSASQLRKWAENPCSKAASLSRGPINRNLNLLDKPKDKWTMADVRSANRTISFVSRMKGVEEGEKVKLKDGTVCPSKRVISLRNWAYNP